MQLKNLCALAFSMFFISSITFGQDGELPRSEKVTLTKSDPYPVVDAAIKKYFPTKDGGVFSVKVRGKEFIFQKFADDHLNEVFSKTEIFDVRGFDFHYISEINNKMYLFFAVYDKPTKSEQLFAREINTEEGGFNGKEQLLVKTDRKLINYGNKFVLDVSNSGEEFIIKYRYYPESRDDSKNKDVIGMYAFTSDLDLIWNNDFTMPYVESYMDNLDFTIGSDGVGYFLIKKYKEEVNRMNREDATNQSFAILKTNADGDFDEIDFKFDSEKIIDDVILTENANKEIVCTGYYRKAKSYSPDGAFVAILGSDNVIAEPQFYEFPLELIKKFRSISERGEKKLEKMDEEGNLGMSNLRMRRLSELSDGSVVLAGEVFYITTTTDSKGNTHTTYHYNDVVVTKINPDGSLGWMEKLPKRSTFESFKLMTSDEFTYILFSDNPNNANLPEDRNPYLCRTKERQVIAYKFDNESGSKEYLPLFGYREIDGTPVYQYNLGRVVGLTENSFAVEMYIKSKSDMMFKVIFD